MVIAPAAIALAAAALLQPPAAEPVTTISP
jgi:hypothetical protein